MALQDEVVAGSNRCAMTPPLCGHFPIHAHPITHGTACGGGGGALRRHFSCLTGAFALTSTFYPKESRPPCAQEPPVRPGECATMRCRQPPVRWVGRAPPAGADACTTCATGVLPQPLPPLSELCVVMCHAAKRMFVAGCRYDRHDQTWTMMHDLCHTVRRFWPCVWVQGAGGIVRRVPSMAQEGQVCSPGRWPLQMRGPVSAPSPWQEPSVERSLGGAEAARALTAAARTAVAQGSSTEGAAAQGAA